MDDPSERPVAASARSIEVPGDPRHVRGPVAVRPPRALSAGAGSSLGGRRRARAARRGPIYFVRAVAAESATHGGAQRRGRSRPPGLPVEVAHPRQGGIERTTTQAGSVHAFEHAALYAKVSGYLKVQNVDIGDRVKRGQLLAVIEDPEVDKAVEQNQAALDQAKAKVRVAEAKVRSAQAAKEAAEAMVKQSETMVAAKVSNQDLQTQAARRGSRGLVARNAVEAKLEDEQKDRFDVADGRRGRRPGRGPLGPGRGDEQGGAGRGGPGRPRRGPGQRRGRPGQPRQGQGDAGVHPDHLALRRRDHPPELPPGRLHPLGLRGGERPGPGRGPDRHDAGRPARCPTPTSRSSTRATRPSSRSSPCPAGRSPGVDLAVLRDRGPREPQHADRGRPAQPRRQAPRGDVRPGHRDPPGRRARTA